MVQEGLLHRLDAMYDGNSTWCLQSSCIWFLYLAINWNLS